jgi:hypothetical protein
MVTPHLFVRRSLSVLLTVALLGAPGSLARQADPPATLGAQLTAMSGTGLMLAGCEERMQTLSSMLSEAGYGPMRSRLVDGTTMIARWYHPGHHTTVMAFAGWHDSGNVFSAGEFAGLMRWNEFATAP